MKKKVQELLTLSRDCRLLYVEDCMGAREATLNLLERFFDTVTIAVDGQDGLEKFNSDKQDFDLIITDINMPKLNGIDMVSKIRKFDNDILIIVLSAHNEKKYFDQAKSLNIADYLTKPVELPLLIETLLKTLKLKEVA